jgi:hypothetical protein
MACLAIAGILYSGVAAVITLMVMHTLPLTVMSPSLSLSLSC